MKKSSRRGKQQGTQVQKTITPFTQGSLNTADSAAVNSQEKTSAPETRLSLQMLREELQTSREAVLVQIRADIAASFKEIKTDFASLRKETKANIWAIRDELTGELARLRSAQAETANTQKEMGVALSDTMDRVTALEKSQQLITKECKKMQEKCQDLENRSRRQNLRLVGVAEGAEGGNMIKFLMDFFPAVLGADNFSSPVVIDWAHRTLALRPTNGERPRPILVCLHYYTDRQKILGKVKGQLSYGGDQVYIFPDMNPEVSRQRAAFNQVKRKLREANVTYTLFYPARLAISVDGVRHSFDSLKAAEEFYNQKIAKID